MSWNFLKLLGAIWLFTEIGAFVKQHSLLLGNNPQFWLLWFSMSAAVTMFIYIMKQKAAASVLAIRQYHLNVIANALENMSLSQQESAVESSDNNETNQP